MNKSLNFLEMNSRTITNQLVFKLAFLAETEDGLHSIKLYLCSPRKLQKNSIIKLLSF